MLKNKHFATSISLAYLTYISLTQISLAQVDQVIQPVQANPANPANQANSVPQTAPILQFAPTPQSAPTPQTTQSFQAAPLPGQTNLQPLAQTNSGYRRLPITYQAASVRLEELRNLMPTARPKDFQDALNDYLDWLSDMADAHWRIYQSFVKVDSLKAQADLERQSNQKIGQLKRQGMLLKAEFLIRENRQPEALQPLVDIVVAEPKTSTGESAYALLKQIGFAEEISLNSNLNIQNSHQSLNLSPSSVLETQEIVSSKTTNLLVKNVDKIEKTQNNLSIKKQETDNNTKSAKANLADVRTYTFKNTKESSLPTKSSKKIAFVKKSKIKRI